MDRQRSRSPKRQRSGSHERGHERASFSSTRRRSRSPEKGDHADIKGHYGKRSRSKSPTEDCSNNRDHKRTKHDRDRDHEKHGNRDRRHERDRDRHGRHEPTGDPDRRDKSRDRKHDRDGDKEKDRESDKRHKHHHHHHEERRRPKAADFYEERHDEKDVVVLPHGARTLSTRNDFTTFEPLFAHYLDLQKGLDMGTLKQDEIRGRWKSFVGKWNRGELAEGWYDPAMFTRLVTTTNLVSSSSVLLPSGTNNMAPPSLQSGSDGRERPEPSLRQPSIEGIERTQHKHGDSEDDDDDDDYGPPPPPVSRTNGSQQQQFGAALPSLDDLRARDDLISEERQAARAAEISDLRFARKADRLQQKERLDDLLPKAEAGSRERKLEKRKELNEKMRAFREPSPGGEVPEGELLGGKDSLDDYKKMLAAQQAKKTERQVRREEIQRARAAEREGRIREYKLKEEGTVEMLRELARRRFG
ncbi:rna helicase [Diplogelasinospora grovesii]|uniref:Rna helicase n=1 Tax=Diplogelasinospora grovesii TaxID=303347 RepID=A0AAN6NIV4_9PEZI|nr:rna helicase [Diplogelasinospora grovesii]